MPEPTYDELSAEFGRLLDEREEWRRNIREQGAEIERLRARVHEVADEANRRGASTEAELGKLRTLMAEASRRHADEMFSQGKPSYVEISGYGRDTAAAILAERDEARAEAEQLRYERRLLGACRRHLDEIADPEGRYTAEAIRTAGDLAQRIVDEIGHPVTDEPALGPDFRERIAELERELEWAVAERDQALKQINR